MHSLLQIPITGNFTQETRCCQHNLKAELLKTGELDISLSFTLNAIHHRHQNLSYIK